MTQCIIRTVLVSSAHYFLFFEERNKVKVNRDGKKRADTFKEIPLISMDRAAVYSRTMGSIDAIESETVRDYQTHALSSSQNYPKDCEPNQIYLFNWKNMNKRI